MTQMITPVMCSGAGPSHLKETAAAVEKRVEEFEAASNLKLLPGAEEPMELQWSNVRIDSVLGTGSFSVVYKCKVTSLARKQGDPNPKDKLYALKQLSTETICCNESFMTGSIDLALEAKILSKLRHENVIEIYGVKGGGIAESFSNSQAGGGFFLVMDLLEETLDQRLEKWREEESQKNNLLMSIFNRKKQSQKRLQGIVDRLQDTILGVVRGMEYCHSQNIMLRDLKPHNIGFDKAGKVRIFDFGLAREVAYDGKSTTNLPRCNTGVAGTLRYISPENAMGKPCGLSADVYSFAILLFEVITLQVPFSEIKLVSEFKDKVIRGRYRPNLKFVPSVLLHDLLKDSWSPIPENRPSFMEISCIIEELIGSDMLTQEGEWRKFVFRKTKPLSHHHCPDGKDCMKDHSGIAAGSSFHRRMSGSHHKKHDHHKNKDCHHHNHKHSCDLGEIQQLRAELKREEQEASRRHGMCGSFHGSIDDQTRSFNENISFNSSRHSKHSHH
ncbi:Probable LIM domain-containing serine/threonine-protein kinase DDB [Seminavis robusta]|uniref:Probable LIM domain-containing serine/threonine-protein kinase DDB n=1 Tax=Seminavis robusta TaxID=568900 RepID=A0A9N8H6E9_9STRA|nr:Probable LIM domain-containing serine/threonine-protein kinase DDB [Seminavis robusta]|eukprot:Sro110_g054900.1 Probable LIM domain-containing serine/threonine-protein kinase DDB (500) ;mRNA; r:58112-59701